MIAPIKSDVPKLALSAAEAAEALGGISERHLMALVAKDAVPHVRLGQRVLFPIKIWEEWMRAKNERFLPAPQAAAAGAKEAT